MSGTRCFVAIELADDIREVLREVRSVLVAQAPAWGGEKWVAENNVHITLKFLGSLEDDVLAGVREAIARELAGVAAFEIGVDGLRAVPRPRRCSMVWARFSDPEGRCAELAARIDRAAVACGLQAEERGFAPHVTLVRARRPRQLPAEALSSANKVAIERRLSMSVLSATIFSSTLTRSAPVYEAIDSWTLWGPG